MKHLSGPVPTSMCGIGNDKYIAYNEICLNNKSTELWYYSYLDDANNRYSVYVFFITIQIEQDAVRWRLVCYDGRFNIIEKGCSRIVYTPRLHVWPPWWRHQMEAYSGLLALCARNSPVTAEFPTQRPVTRSFDVFFDLCLNKRLTKQSWSLWFETPSCPLWCHCNATAHFVSVYCLCDMIHWHNRLGVWAPHTALITSEA